MKPIQRICIVYGNEETIQSFLEVNQMAFEEGDSGIGCIELDLDSNWFKEVRKGLIKGFEE